MKVAEALAERSDCQKRLEEIKSRLATWARIQEGEEPAEDPNELLSARRDGRAIQFDEDALLPPAVIVNGARD